MAKYLMLIPMFFLLSCEQEGWNWKPDPYAADAMTQSITNANGAIVNCSDMQFTDFTCFNSENLADLYYNIEKLNIPAPQKRQILNIVKSAMRKEDRL